MLDLSHLMAPRSPRHEHLISDRNPNGTEHVNRLCRIVDGEREGVNLTPTDLWELKHVDRHPSVDWVVGVCRLVYRDNAYAMDRACKFSPGTTNRLRRNTIIRYDTIVRISMVCNLPIPQYIRREYD